MRREITFSELAEDTIATLRLPGESISACVDRLVCNLAQIAYDQDNYEQHFGPQSVATISSYHCGVCGSEIAQPATGRRRKYCPICVERNGHRAPAAQSRKSGAENVETPV